jgi:beta-glucosidase
MGNVIDYNLPDPAIEEKVNKLIAQMTLAEKVGQLVQKGPFQFADWQAVMEKRDLAEQQGKPFSYHDEVPAEFEAHIRTGRTGTVMCDDPQVTNYLQHLAVNESRLHIPLLIAADVIHGYRTIFPIPLAESCTWNPKLIEEAERIAAEEASSRGVNWIFAPMVDIARDPRWGRVAEGSGEDPCLGALIARAKVRGFQSANLVSGRRVAACPKHYVAYGAAEAGRDYNSVDVSERTLREVYLPPFKDAFDAGASSTMSAFNDIAGVPASANPLTLRTVLRDEWQWRGVVVSDFNAIGELVNHGIATNLKEAAQKAILAGVDIDMESDAYARHLAELVEEGTVPIEVVDEAVRRVLRLKFNLGLFERPFTDEKLAQEVILQDEFRAHALAVARQSVVLLKNKADLLPLKPGALRLAVIGPLANSPEDMLGTWRCAGQAEDAESILQGICSYLPGSAFTFVAGCSLTGSDRHDFRRAVSAAEESDVVISVIGEGADLSGEACSRAHLGLPGIQQELVDSIAAAGKPMIGVLICGRPLVVPRLAEQLDALLVAWHGGIRAGQAVADILFGVVNPSGKLTASWPRAEGQIPVYYAHRNTGRPAEGDGTLQFDLYYRSTYLDEPNAPLFHFGFGLSYTRFEYSGMAVETPHLSQGGTLAVRAQIKNVGKRAGAEIVQLYIRDLTASVARPVKELKGFQRITLAPSETQTVRFELPARELGFYRSDMQYIVEPGLFTVWIGPNSAEGLEGKFKVTG